MKLLEYYEGSAKKTKEYPDDTTDFGYAFQDTMDVKLLTSIVIPDWVTRLEDNAFLGATSLVSCVIPKSVTDIGMHAYFGATKRKSIVVPPGITRIRRLFDGCSSLVSVVIPHSVTSILLNAFNNCSSLVDITIPEAANVSPSAFLGCSQLEAKSSGYHMTVVQYYRDFYHQRIKERVTVLKSLLVYQEMTEKVPSVPMPTYALTEGHLNGPLAYRKITAFELWREIVMYL